MQGTKLTHESLGIPKKFTFVHVLEISCTRNRRKVSGAEYHQCLLLCECQLEEGGLGWCLVQNVNKTGVSAGV